MHLLSQLTNLFVGGNADMICVVQNGRIIEQGTHEQLIKQAGLYQELYQRQFLSAAE